MSVSMFHTSLCFNTCCFLLSGDECSKYKNTHHRPSLQSCVGSVKRPRLGARVWRFGCICNETGNTKYASSKEQPGRSCEAHVGSCPGAWMLVAASTRTVGLLCLGQSHLHLKDVRSLSSDFTVTVSSEEPAQ